MLTIMCPNCRHRFPAPRCCQEPSEETSWKEMEEGEETKIANSVHPATYYVGGLLVPRGYTSGGGCFINAPTIVHGPAVFQSGITPCGSNVEIADIIGISETMEHPCDTQMSSAKQNHCPLLQSPIGQSTNQTPLIVTMENVGYGMTPSKQYVATTDELTGGSVTIATPDIQSGGCVIQSTEAGILVQASHVEIQPKLTGGGCLVQKRLSTEDEQLMASKYMENCAFVGNNAHRILVAPPSGCSELPGSRGIFPSKPTRENIETTSMGSRQRKIPSAIKTNDCCDCNNAIQQILCRCHKRLSDAHLVNDCDSLLLEPVNGSVQVRVNATVQLPANLGQCRVNITATTATPFSQVAATEPRTKNNFNGGGIVQLDELNCATRNRIVATENSNGCNNNEQRDETPTTPVSRLMSCPWGIETDSLDLHINFQLKYLNRLREVRRLLQTCGWYYEGISWQQSENLLKDTSVGRWLMRDSSLSRFTFAVSVQTAKGPTSVRVQYILGRFRLDAEPCLTKTMPLFDCPITMLEHYVEYSKKMDEHRREVWVDYSGQLYSQIYMTKPLVKEIRSLSHLARLAVNQNKLPTEHLPLLIRNYLSEYPYTL